MTIQQMRAEMGRSWAVGPRAGLRPAGWSFLRKTQGPASSWAHGHWFWGAVVTWCWPLPVRENRRVWDVTQVEKEPRGSTARPEVV